MQVTIYDGTGQGKSAHVDANNQLHVFSVTATEIQDSTKKGKSFNINTGYITLTSSSDSAVLYFKNNESPINGEASIVIDSIVFAVKSSSGTVSEQPEFTVIRNPKTGTIVTNAVPVDMVENRNFGSSNNLDSSAIYKGVEGDTFTDGDDFAIFQVSEGSRAIGTIDIELTKGSSIGVKCNPYTSAGNTKIYVALICHKKDGNNNGNA